MNTSARPIPLHVGLQFVCRVHGLTPHASTGRCPFELIKEGPAPSLFPQLTRSTQRSLELTAVQQSMRPGKRSAFCEGERVVVYDYKSKLSTVGVVKQVLGSNTYYVDCGQGLHHVSGDALSKSVLDLEDFTNGSKLTSKNGSQLVQDNGSGSQLVQEDGSQLVQEDSDDTQVSDSSDDEDYFGQDVVPLAAPRRRRRIRHQELGPVRTTRLRPRN